MTPSENMLPPDNFQEQPVPALAHRTITEIAMGCGFGNSAHFSRAFKAYAGMSPSEFRALGH